MILTACLQNNDPSLIILYFSSVVLHIDTFWVFKIGSCLYNAGTSEVNLR